ncbi:MAG: hypothetical protein N3G78_06945 [Desulfobacterota bacterium]|nr:hypothetical protein [Thermodesulfobacteriota bacterium]
MKEIPRKQLDSQEFFKLRQVTEKISQALGKRLNGHLDTLRPLFLPRKLLGTYVKSAVKEDVPRSEKAFAELQELFGSVCEKPFGLPKKLQPPLPPINQQLEVTPYQYPLRLEGDDRTVQILAPTQWVLSFRGDCSLERVRAMVSGREPRQTDEMQQALIDHLSLVVFLRHFPELRRLLEDLRYEVEVQELVDLGNLPVVVLKAPIATFLPPDDFILQITQLSGISAFQEIVDLEAIEKMTDSLKEQLKSLVS